MMFAQAATDKSLLDNTVLDQWEIPFGEWMDQTVDWIAVNMSTVLSWIEEPFELLIGALVRDFLAQVPWLWVVLGMFLLASLIRNIRVGFFVAGALTICGLLGNAYWIETARTIGFIAVAVILCVIIGIPVGILSGRFDSVWQVVRPVLDAMQVVHSFVYMLPFIFFWGIGEVSATMVTMIFALPPLIRLTNLGIRQVPGDVVEASRAYGASELKVLVDVQLPLARPAIMTGINQTLLLAISMLGIAAIMGAGGLGRLLFRALSNQDVALAASAGLAFFLVAVVLDRMSQKEDSDGGNLFRRIHQAWVHRTDPESLLPEADEASAVTVYKQADQYAPIARAERAPMAMTLAGAVAVAVAVFLPWTSDAGKFSAYGRREDQDLEGMVFNGLDLSGGSWFGIIILLFAIFVAAAVVSAWRSPGEGPRWLTSDGAVTGSIAMTLVALSHLLASPWRLALDPGTGIGVIVAVAGGVLATVGSIMWLRVADHAPLHPLSLDVAWGRVIGTGIAVVVLVIGMFSGWSFDSRQDVVISPELQTEIDALQQEARDNPTDAGPIAARLSALMAQAQAQGAVVTDGISEEGPRLGVWTTLAGLLGLVATLFAAGVFGRDEQSQWRWSAIVAGIGAGIAAISLAWIITHVRSANPNYVSGIGAFLTMMGGTFLIASTTHVLGEFRRSKIYDDDVAADVLEVTTAQKEPAEITV
ncbi:MAG: ABC transporter permease subunit [Acidimicrobiia bacterium]|nr:ABC transporter permease subunit [Acidimicrobiia bacterium]